MNKISRRSVIKGIARAGMMGAAGALAPAIIGCSRQIDLNIVLHGLFVVNVLDEKIELLTPFTGEHLYQVGSWDYSSVKPLHRGESYEFKGLVGAPKPPLFDHECNTRLTNPPFTFKVNYGASHCCITLPYPKEIHYLRCVRGGDNEYRPPKQITLRSFALCQVLVYSVEDYCDLEMTNAQWKPDIDWATNTTNLHLWAEPLRRLTADHANAAYQTLNDLTGLNIQLGTTSSAPLDNVTGVNGLTREEEQGLSEWIDGGETSHPTNCNVLTLDQTISTTEVGAIVPKVKGDTL